MKIYIVGALAVFAIILSGLSMYATSGVSKKLATLSETASTTAATANDAEAKANAIIEFIKSATQQQAPQGDK